jgi:hypothetical protein
MTRDRRLMPNDVLTPCPRWCAGVHNPRQGWGESQYHATEPLPLDVELGGEGHRFGEVDITQYPNATDPLKREAYISLHLEDPSVEMEPANVEALATAFEQWAGQLRGLAAKLTRIRADDRAALAWRTQRLSASSAWRSPVAGPPRRRERGVSADWSRAPLGPAACPSGPGSPVPLRRRGTPACSLAARWDGSSGPPIPSRARRELSGPPGAIRRRGPRSPARPGPVRDGGRVGLAGGAPARSAQR